MKIIGKYNKNEKKEIKVRNIISKNITLPKGGLSTSFSKRYIQELFNGLDYYNNLLKKIWIQEKWNNIDEE